MRTASDRQRFAPVRRLARYVRPTLVLWIALAVVVWNAVFDHVLALAGRHYLQVAAAAAARGGPYVRLDESMRPAVRHAAADASFAAAGTLLAALPALALRHLLTAGRRR
jgi:hypothetical protein